MQEHIANANGARGSRAGGRAERERQSMGPEDDGGEFLDKTPKKLPDDKEFIFSSNSRFKEELTKSLRNSR